MANQDLPIADNTISIKITGDSSSGFGTSVAFAGNINGDVIADILVGAPSGSSGLGAVYVIFGTNSPTDAYIGDLLASNSACMITGEISGGNTGFSVSSAGDQDGDGLADVLIGAPNENGNTGAVYVVYGEFIYTQVQAATPSISLSAAYDGVKMIGENSGDNFGYSVAYIGDFNRDGYGDIVIGAPDAPILSTPGATKSGVVYMIRGGAGNSYPSSGTITFTIPIPSFVTKILGENGQYKFGTSVSGAGYVNNDDYADIIIGAPAADSNYGAAYVMYGSNSWTTTVIVDGLSFFGFKLAGENSGDYFGTIVTGIGDVNGDGLDDVAVGVPNYSSNTGKVYVVFGKSMTGTAGTNLGYNTGYQLEGNETSGYFGSSIANARDFNGNDRPDVVVGTKLTRAYAIFDQRCPRTCSSCQSIFVCDACFVNYCLLDNACIACPDGYYYDSGLTDCQQCPSGCTKCLSLTECLECESGQYLYNFQCGACPTSTFISGKECSDCPGTCLTCTDSTTCQTCQLGYGISGTGCITCPSSTNLTNGHCIAEIHKVTTSSSSISFANLSSAAFQISSLLSSSMSVGSSMSIKLNLISKIVQNIRYLNISYSSKLLEIFQTWDTNVLAINPPDSLKTDIPSKSLPYVFARYDLDPSFLTNFWLNLIMILGSLIISITFNSVKYFTENSLPSVGLPYKIIKFMSRASVNFFLVQLYGSLDDIVFFSILEVKSMALTISHRKHFALTLLFLIFVCAILGFQSYILLSFRNLRNQALKTHNTEQLERFQKKYEPVKILFDDFDDSSLLQQGFLALLTARNLVLTIALTTLYEYPLAQTILFFILSVFILAFLILAKPFKEFIGMASQYFCEGVLIVVQLSTLIMAMMDSAEVDGSEMRKRLGDGIFVMNIILNIGGMIFLLVETLEEIFEYFLARYLKLYPEKIIEMLLKWKKQEGNELSHEEIRLNPETRNESIELNRSNGQVGRRRIMNIRDVDINRKKEDMHENFGEESSIMEPMNTSGIIQENQPRPMRNFIKKPRILRPSRTPVNGPVDGLEMVRNHQRMGRRENELDFNGQSRMENNSGVRYYPQYIKNNDPIFMN